MQVALRTTQPRAKLRVDRAGAGKILGASIASKGPAVGHGFEIDDKTLDQIAKLAGKAEPVGWWTHCEDGDGLGAHLGRWSNIAREADRVSGDFEFSAAAKHVRPVGLGVDAPTYLMDLAEQDPSAFGVSPFIFYEIEQKKDTPPAARVLAVTRADFVGWPATNPRGLLSAKSPEEGPVDIDALKKENAELRAKGDAHTVELAALRAGVKAAEERETARRKADTESYLSGLQSKATAAQVPLSAEDLGHVRALMERGDEATAKVVGGLLVSRSQALGAKSSAPGTTPLGKTNARAGFELADALDAADAKSKK